MKFALFSFKVYFTLFMCIYAFIVYLCATCVHVPVEAISGCWITWSWCMCTVWVLGTKLGSSGKTASLTAGPSLSSWNLHFSFYNA